MRVSDLNREIRDFINHNHRIQKNLVADRGRWHTLCSAMDVIDDTEIAILAYFNLPAEIDEAILYVIHYGVLQALQIQQDAVGSMCKSLGVSYSGAKALDDIRRIRARAVGHPTFGKESSLQIASFIARSSLSKRGFVLTTAYEDGRKDHRENIDLEVELNNQQNELCIILTRIIEELKVNDMNHRRTFQDIRISDLFSPFNEYCFEKMWNGVFHQAHRSLGYSHIVYIRQTVIEYQNEIERRQELYDKDTLDRVLNSIDKLSAYFEKIDDSNFDDLDAYVYLQFIEDRYIELKEQASNIDQNYTSVTAP